MAKGRIQHRPSYSADAAGRRGSSNSTSASSTAPMGTGVVERPKSTAAEEVLLLTIPQVGRALNVSRSQVYRLLNARLLPLKHIGAAARVPASAVRDFVAGLPVAHLVPATA